MPGLRVCSLAAVWFLFSSTARGTEPETASQPEKAITAADEWAGKMVAAKSRDVVLRQGPADESPRLAFCWTGIWLQVKEVQGEWLNVDKGWVRTADVVREDRLVDYFTSQLARQENAYSYLGRALGWFIQHDTDKATADVSEALRLEPRNARIYYVRGKIAAALMRPDEELAEYDRALEIDPRDAVLLVSRGYARSLRNDFERAIRDYDLAIELLPHDSWARAARGYCWTQKGDYDKALADFNAAIALDPKDAFAFTKRAAVHGLRREMDEAITDATEAIRLDPKAGGGFATRGSILAIQGKLDDALADLNEAIRLGVSDYQIHNNRGRVHFLKGDLDAAVLDYTQAISLKGDNVELYFRRAEVWASKRDNANAILDLSECLKLAPQAVEAHVQRGRLRSEPQPDGTMRDPAQLDEALDDFQQALRLDPRHVNALIHRANVWARKNEPRKAMDDLAAVISINPNESEAYRQRAGIYTSRGEYDSAIEDLTVGIRVEPTKTACLLDRAVALALKGEYQKAIDDCNAVLKIQPNNKIAYFHIAMSCSWSDRNEDALEAYGAVLWIDPDDASALLSRGNLALRLGKFGMALADFARLLKSDEYKVDAYRSRGQLWLEQRQWDKALADLNEAIRLKPDDDFALCQRARCWVCLKQFDKAIRDADEALRLDPNSDFAATVREWAVRTKKNPSNSDDPFSLAANEGVLVVTADADAPFAPSCYVKLQGPAGLGIAFESGSEQFGPPTLPVPHRLAMFDNGMERFKLVPHESGSARAVYARVDWGHLSQHEAGMVKKTPPSLPLTKDDLDTVGSGTDLVKVLVLIHAQDEQAGKPGFEVLTSTPTKSGPEVVAEAARRGTIIAALFLSQRLPEKTPLLRPSVDDRLVLDRFVRFLLRGPRGLMLAHESADQGKFDSQPQPVPAEFAFLPGIEMRFQLTGAPVPIAAPLYVLLSISAAWPAELGPPGDTELPIKFSPADIEAAVVGKPVVQVIYLSKQSEEQGLQRIGTLNSTTMPPDSDPVAEASRRGQVLATVRLSKELLAARNEIPSRPKVETTQMIFVGPEGMTIQWDAAASGKFDSEPLAVPGKHNFPRGAICRLKISQIPGHEGAEAYPTLEIAVSTPRTADYLTANGVPVELSAQDIDDMLSGKSFMKVVYLPDVTDPDAPNAVETLVASRLQPGLDPFLEATRRGTILAILRAGATVDDKTSKDRSRTLSPRASNRPAGPPR